MADRFRRRHRHRRGPLGQVEDLTDDQFVHRWNAVLGEGTIGRTLLTAWIDKENLRNLLALALALTGAELHRIGQARWKFLIWCTGSGIPEVRQLATTADRWWPEISAFIDTGHSNARSSHRSTVKTRLDPSDEGGGDAGSGEHGLRSGQGT
ncbi:transposase [Streptomyces sp. NPDC007861]|uniref:transposase n=1 Tax=Streptomyces sp. NPDC007861 TaxID=3154893 RepID=UPI0033DF1DCF